MHCATIVLVVCMLCSATVFGGNTQCGQLAQCQQNAVGSLQTCLRLLTAYVANWGVLTNNDCDSRWTRLAARQYQLDALIVPTYAACLSSSPSQQCPQFPAPVEPTFTPGARGQSADADETQMDNACTMADTAQDTCDNYNYDCDNADRCDTCLENSPLGQKSASLETVDEAMLTAQCGA